MYELLIVLLLCLAVLLAIAIGVAATFALDKKRLKIALAKLHDGADYDAETVRFLRSQIARFDRDGDGKPGGSRKRASLIPQPPSNLNQPEK